MNKCLSMIMAMILPVSAMGQTTLSLSSAIAMAHERSYDAMVAKLNYMSQYWSYRSFKAEQIGRAHV